MHPRKIPGRARVASIFILFLILARCQIRLIRRLQPLFHFGQKGKHRACCVQHVATEALQCRGRNATIRSHFKAIKLIWATTCNTEAVMQPFAAPFKPMYARLCHCTGLYSIVKRKGLLVGLVLVPNGGTDKVINISTACQRKPLSLTP